MEWTTDRVLKRAAVADRSQVAAVCDRESLSYGELDDSATRFAHALAEAGVGRGDRVAVLMGNCLEYLIAYHGVGRLGAIFVPLVTESTLSEVRYVLEHSEARLLVVDEERFELIRGESGLSCVEHVIRVSELPGLLSRQPADMLERRPTQDEPVAFMYTSGSTGRPKAVIHSHYTAVAQAEAVCERMGYTAGDRLMTVFPLFHGNALVWSALAAVWAGARVIVQKRFSASRFWAQARRHGATEINLLVGAINMVLAQPESDDDRDHQVRLILANVTEAVHDRFVARFGVDIVSTWALAEGPLGTMTAPGHGYRAGEIGWPMGQDNEVAVFDEADRAVGPGVVGELVQRNRAAMLGYYKNEAETERVLRGGWVHSGDLGYRDEQGLFYFVGRQKHVIRRSGENVSGEEVEERLNAHPAIAEAAVIAVPDDIRGEEVKACVVVREGQRLAEVDVVDWAGAELAEFKLPRYVEFLDELPRTGPERVDRPALARRPGVTDCWDRARS